MLLISPAYLSLLLLPLALASPVPENESAKAQASIYEAVTERVNFELSALSRDLNQMERSRPSDRTNLASIITNQSNRLIAASRDGASAMHSAAPPTLLAANELIIPINRLAVLTRQIHGEWLAIREIVFSMNGQQKVTQLLKDTNTAAAEFSYAMNAKMPGGVREVGRIYGDAVDSMVKDVIKAYERPRGGSTIGWN